MLEFENHPFTNKSTVKGVVALDPGKLSAVSSIRVILKGMVILRGVSSELVYHDTEEISLESGNSKAHFPFAISFPSQSLPPSLTGAEYSVEYTLQAVVRRHSLLHKTSTEQALLTYVPTSHPPTPNHIVKKEQFGDISVQLSLPKALFQSPEPMDIQLVINSPRPLSVSRVTLTAESKTRWRAPGYRVMDNVVQQIPIAATTVNRAGATVDLSDELSELVCVKYLPPTFSFPPNQKLPYPHERGQARSKELGIAREYDLIVGIECAEPMELRLPIKVLSPYLSGARADSPELPPVYLNGQDAQRRPDKGLYLHDLNTVRHQMLGGF